MMNKKILILAGLCLFLLAGSAFIYSNNRERIKSQNVRNANQNEQKLVSDPAEPTKIEEKSIEEEPKPEPTAPDQQTATPQPSPKPEVLAASNKAASPTPAAPKPSPAPAPLPQPASNAMLDLVNAARKTNGLNAVVENSKLNSAALVKSKDMFNQGYFSHTNPQGKNDFSFVKDVGYNYSAIGSNIAKGQFPSEKAVFDAWMASPGHKANILASFGQQIGYAGFNGYYTFFIAKPL